MDIYRGNDTHTLVHPEDRSKGFLGMIQGSVTIIENTDTVPQLWIILGREIFRKVRGGKDSPVNSHLWRRKQIEGLLVGGVCPLQIVAHEITVAYMKHGLFARGRVMKGETNEPRELHTSPLSPCNSTTRWK